MQDIYKTYTKYQAAAAWPGPEARTQGRPGRLGAGLGRCRWVFSMYFVYILYIVVYIYCIYLYIFDKCVLNVC